MTPEQMAVFDSLGISAETEPSITPEQEAVFDNLGLKDDDEMSGNLVQDVDAETRAKAIKLSRDKGLDVLTVERNLDSQLLNDKSIAIMQGLTVQPGEATQELVKDPIRGPAVRDDIENLSTAERFMASGGNRWAKGRKLIALSYYGEKAMDRTITPQERVEMEFIQEQIQAMGERDYHLEGPLLETAAFVHGAVLENLPILWNTMVAAQDEALMGASAGAVLGAAASVPTTAGAASPLTASVGAGIGYGTGLKMGSAREMYRLEGSLAYLDYEAMTDKETGELMDKDVALAAATIVGVANAGLEMVAFERLMKTIPGMDKLMTKFTRGGMKTLMENSTAKHALARFGVNITKVGIVEALTEGGQELFTILGGIAAAEVAPGEFDTGTWEEHTTQIWDSMKQGAAGGAGLATPGSGVKAFGELRAERIAKENVAKLEELGRMAQESLTAERLPDDFKAHLMRVRDIHGEGTQTLVDAARLTDFYQMADLSDAQVQERMPEIWANMQEARVTGEEVVIPFEELGAELARLEGFEELIPDIRVTAEGLTSRETDALVADREKVYEEYAELASREEGHEAASNRVQEDVRTMLEEAGVTPEVAEHQSKLHGEFWKRAGERFGRDPFEMYKSYAGLSIQRSMLELQDGAGFERSDAIIARLREGKWPTNQEMFGASLTEWLRKSGGLLDEGGELSTRDLGGPQGLIRAKGMTLEQAHEAAIEAGYLPAESWQDASKGDLLDLIDKDLRGEGVYRLGEGDVRMQELSYEMEQLQQVFDAMDLDVDQLSNEELRAALVEASEFQGQYLNEGDYEKLHPKVRAIVDEALEHTEQADRIRAQLIELKNTPWAKQAIAGAKARVAILRLLDGKEPGHKSTLDAPQAAKLRRVLKNHGVAGMRAYLGDKSLIGHPTKPLNAVNSSFLNCEPSRNCAKYCYATGGNYQYAVNINKGELASIFIERFPVEAAESVAADYKAMPEYHNDKALRLFDKGDGSMAWIPFIKELNRRGVRAHIFSKRPDFLRAVPEGNVRLLSVDQTNLEMAEENPDLQVALVYEGTEGEITWMNEHADQIQLILPIMGEKGAGAAERKAAAVARIPKQLRKNKCPIDAEVVSIKSGKVKWDCTRCDKGGGVGCYNAQTTKQSKSLTVPFPETVKKAEKDGMVRELEEMIDGLTRQERDLLRPELANLLSQARERIDVERATDQQRESGGSIERTEEAAGALRSDGSREVKKLYQSAYHGTGLQDLYEFLTKFIGTGEGSQAFGWGLYFAESLGVAEYYRSIVGDVTTTGVASRVIDHGVNQELEDLSLEFSDKDYPGMRGGVTRAGFIMADEIAEAVQQVGGTKAAVIAELTSRKEKHLEEWAVKGPIYGDTQTYDTAIAAIERDIINIDHLTDMEKAFEAEGQVYQVELLPKDSEWLLWDTVVPDEKFGLLIKHAIAVGDKKLAANLERARRQAPTETKWDGSPLWDGEGLYGLVELHRRTAREASAFLAAAGIPGNKFLDYDSRYGQKPVGQETYNFAVFEDKSIIITDRLYQKIHGRPRGYITMDETRSWLRVTLTEEADLSTFLHESGHYFLEMMRRLAESPDAPTDLKNDLAILEDHFGIPRGETWHTEAHEEFARSFEQYLMNGEAPSLELQTAFASFKQWLKRIYERLSNLNVRMSKEVRGVMDRMLAAEDAIAEARSSLDMRPVFESAEAAGMSAVDFHTYHALLDKAMKGALDELELKALREYKNIFSAEYKTLRAQVQAEVEAEVAADPIQQAKHLLRTGKMLDGTETPKELQGIKLSSGSLMAAYPHHKILQRLMGLHRKDGMAIDLVAGLFGYETGDAFVQAMLKAPARAKVVKAETEKRMLARYGDMMNDGTLEAEAMRSMHSNSVSNFLLAELRALSKAARLGIATPVRVIKQAAEARVANMKIQDLTPGRYRQAEARESRKAIEAAAKGDFVAAHEHKRKQLLNHWLSRYISEARDKTAKQRDYLKKFDTRKVRERMGRAGREAYLDAIDSYLNGIELRKVPIKSIKARQSLAEFLAAREEADEAVQIPDRLRHEANLKNFKVMSVAEFDEIHDAIRNIEHLANLKNKLLSAKEKREFEATKDGFVAQIYETQEKRPAEKEQNRRLFGRIWHRIKKFQAELTKPEFIARWIDGETAGLAHRLIFQPFVDAQIAKLDMEKAMAAKLGEIFKGMSPETKAKMHQKFDIFGVSTTGQEVLAIALNLGNAGNTKKLIEGDPRGWTEETLRARLSEILTLDDWQLVQNIWDQVDTLWPHIEALNVKMTGLAPPRVEPKAFDVEGVTFRGGYYPVIYDPVKSPKAAGQKEAKDFRGLIENNFMRPDVSKGFTEARTEYVGPLLLSLDVLPAHLSEVIHYLTHYEAVTQVNKLLSNKEVVTALRATFGEEIQQQFRPWLQSVANASTVPDATGTIDVILRQARHGTSVVAMGWKFSTAMMQAFGLFTTVDAIGFKYTMQGMVEAAAQLGAGVRVFEDINEKSGEVRHAMRTFDRDARQIIEQTFTKTGAAKTWVKWQAYTFALMGTVQKMVNMATWYGAYAKAIDEGKNETRATQYADASVRQSQSGGGVKDLAAIQRGGEGQQMFVMFYTYFSVLHNRLSETGRQVKGKQRIKDTPHVAARLTWLILLPVFFEALARNEWPDEDDEPISWWLRRSMLYGLVTIPMARDIASGVAGEYGYNMSPVASLLERSVRGLQGVVGLFDPEGEMTEGQMRGLMDAVGVTAKLPTGQLWILYNWLARATEGELENPVHELIYKAREE